MSTNIKEESIALTNVHDGNPGNDGINGQTIKPQILRATNELIVFDCLDKATYTYSKWQYRGWRPQGCQNVGEAGTPLIESILLTDSVVTGCQYGWKFSGATATTNMTRVVQDSIPIDKNKTYTLSYWAKATIANASTPPYCRLEWWNSNQTGAGKTNAALTTSWQQYSFTFSPTSVTNGVINAHFGIYNLHPGDTAYIAGLKMEEGDEATPWCEYEPDIDMPKLTSRCNWTDASGSYVVNDIMACKWDLNLSRRPKLNETFTNFDGSSKVYTWQVIPSGLTTKYMDSNAIGTTTVTTDQTVVVKVISIENSTEIESSYNGTPDSLQILRATNEPVSLTSNTTSEPRKTYWENRGWRSASGGDASRTCSALPNKPFTNCLYGWTIKDLSTNTNATHEIAQDGVPLVTGQTYVMSCYARKTDASYSSKLRLQWWLDSSHNEVHIFNLTTTWTKYYFVFKPTINNPHIYFGLYGSIPNEEIQIAGMKLEKGDIPTEWSEYPGDADRQFIAYYCTKKQKNNYILPIEDGAKTTDDLITSSTSSGIMCYKDLYSFKNTDDKFSNFNLEIGDQLLLHLEWSVVGAPAGSKVRIGTCVSPFEFFGDCVYFSAGSSRGTVDKVFTVNQALIDSGDSNKIRFRFDTTEVYSSNGFKFTVEKISITRVSPTMTSPTTVSVATASPSKTNEWCINYNSTTPVNSDWPYMYKSTGSFRTGKWSDPELMYLYDGGILGPLSTKDKAFYQLIGNGSKGLIYDKDGTLYINADYINTGVLRVGGTDISNALIYANFNTSQVKIAGWTAKILNTTYGAALYYPSTASVNGMGFCPSSGDSVCIWAGYKNVGGDPWHHNNGGDSSNTWDKSCNFYVTANGKMYAKAGKIAGLSINENSLTFGTLGEQNGVFLANANVSNEIQIGDSSADTWRLLIGSRFGVTSDGIIYSAGAVFGVNAQDSGCISLKCPLNINTNGYIISEGGPIRLTSDFGLQSSFEDSWIKADYYQGSGNTPVSVYKDVSGLHAKHSGSSPCTITVYYTMARAPGVFSITTTVPVGTTYTEISRIERNSFTGICATPTGTFETGDGPSYTITINTVAETNQPGFKYKGIIWPNTSGTDKIFGAVFN